MPQNPHACAVGCPCDAPAFFDMFVPRGQSLDEGSTMLVTYFGVKTQPNLGVRYMFQDGCLTNCEPGDVIHPLTGNIVTDCYYPTIPEEIPDCYQCVVTAGPPEGDELTFTGENDGVSVTVTVLRQNRGNPFDGGLPKGMTVYWTVEKEQDNAFWELGFRNGQTMADFAARFAYHGCGRSSALNGMWWGTCTCPRYIQSNTPYPFRWAVARSWILELYSPPPDPPPEDREDGQEDAGDEPISEIEGVLV